MEDNNTAGQASAPDNLDVDVSGNKRSPGWMDHDAGMVAMGEARALQTDEHLESMQEKMESFEKQADYKAIYGDKAPILVDNDKVMAEMAKLDPNMPALQALKEATDNAEATAIKAALAATPAAEGGAPAGQPAGGDAVAQGGKPEAAKPLTLEQTIAGIRMTGSREHRFVIDGDPRIQTAFYAELESRGKLRFQGGAPVIGVSRAKAESILREVVAREGVNLQPALKMDFERSGMFQRNHTIEVFVVGDKATIDKHVDRIGALLQKMDSAKYLGDDGKQLLKDGKLQLDGDKPATFTASRSLQELVAASRSTVEAYSASESAKDQLRMQHRNNEADQKIAKMAAERGDSGPGSASQAGPGGAKSDAPAGPPSKYVADLQRNLDAAVNVLGGLTEKNGKQIAAEGLMNSVRTLKAKDEPELLKIPVEQRQQMFTQMALVVAKADAGALGKDFTSEKIDRTYEADPARDKPASGSIREKVSSLIDAEKVRDPEFAGRALQALSNMEKAGTASREQIEKAAGAIAPGREIPPPSVEVFVPQADDASKVKTSSSDVPSAEASKQSVAAAETTRVQGSLDFSPQQAVEQLKFMLDGPLSPADAQSLKTLVDDVKQNAPELLDKLDGETKDALRIALLSAAAADAAPATDKVQANSVESALPASEAAVVDSAAGAKPDQPGADAQGAGADGVNYSAVASEQPAVVASVEQVSADGKAAEQAGAAASAEQATQDAKVSLPSSGEAAIEQPSLEVKESATAGAQAAPEQPGDEAKAPTPVASEASPEQAPVDAKVPAPAATEASVEAAAPKAEQTAAAVEKANPLVEKLDAIVKAGPDALSREDASALLATLEGRQTAKLASLDGRPGTAPTETLTRIEGVLNEVTKGRLGDDLAASAKDLSAALEKWKTQDANRVMTSTGLSHADIAAKGAEIRATDSAWHSAPVAAGPNAKGIAQEAGTDARVAAGERYTQTEMAAGKLAVLMSNPAGNFTNRDKSWNEQNVDAAAKAVMRIDVESTKDMSQGQRNQVAAYAAWLADNANSGRLPGFDGAEGKARADALTMRASELIGGASGAQSPAVGSQLNKADKMVDAMVSRTRGATRTSVVTRPTTGASRAPAGSTSRNASMGASRAAAPAPRAQTPNLRTGNAVQLAKEIGHAVYKTGELTEQGAKFMLKNADALTPDSMKSLTPTEKAQAVEGLKHLAEEVRGGALGDFKKLPADVQSSVHAAEKTAVALQSALQADPANAAALVKAQKDLRSNTPAAAGKDDMGNQAKSPDQSLTKPASQPSNGRSMDR